MVLQNGEKTVMFFLMYVTIPQMISALKRSNNVKLQLQGVIIHAVYFLHLITRRESESTNQPL